MNQLSTNHYMNNQTLPLASTTKWKHRHAQKIRTSGDPDKPHSALAETKLDAQLQLEPLVPATLKHVRRDARIGDSAPIKELTWRTHPPCNDDHKEDLCDARAFEIEHGRDRSISQNSGATLSVADGQIRIDSHQYARGV